MRTEDLMSRVVHTCLSTDTLAEAAGGKERMRRLMSVVAARRAPFRELVTHSFRLAQIEEAYELFAQQRDGVLKVAIRP